RWRVPGASPKGLLLAIRLAPRRRGAKHRRASAHSRTPRCSLAPDGVVPERRHGRRRAARPLLRGSFGGCARATNGSGLRQPLARNRPRAKRSLRPRPRTIATGVVGLDSAPRHGARRGGVVAGVSVPIFQGEPSLTLPA